MAVDTSCGWVYPLTVIAEGGRAGAPTLFAGCNFFFSWRVFALPKVKKKLDLSSVTLDFPLTVDSRFFQSQVCSGAYLTSKLDFQFSSVYRLYENFCIEACYL